MQPGRRPGVHVEGLKVSGKTQFIVSNLEMSSGWSAFSLVIPMERRRRGISPRLPPFAVLFPSADSSLSFGITAGGNVIPGLSPHRHSEARSGEASLEKNGAVVVYRNNF
jgi:hypothetical protein